MPHDSAVRATPQLSVPETVPQFLPNREQNTASDSVKQTQTFDALHICVDEQVPQEATVRAVPQLSFALTAPQFLPRREQNEASVSGAQTQTLPVQV